MIEINIPVRADEFDETQAFQLYLLQVCCSSCGDFRANNMCNGAEVRGPGQDVIVATVSRGTVKDLTHSKRACITLFGATAKECG